MTIIFGGTTEGREAAAALRDAGEDVLVCVMSSYARSLLPGTMLCHVGALDASQMKALLLERQPSRVVDATHPYAVQVTQQLHAVCEELGIRYERIERPVSDGGWRDAVEWAEDAEEAAEALWRTDGPILLTTGSKTLPAYAARIPAERLWVRVLPTMAALEICSAAGIPASHIIAMQGPFTEPLNAALYDMLGIRTVVTKDSGHAGGADEKILPALARGIHVIVIRRPAEKERESL